MLTAERPLLGDVIVDRNSVDSAVRKLKVNIISYIGIVTSKYPSKINYNNCQEFGF